MANGKRGTKRIRCRATYAVSLIFTPVAIGSAWMNSSEPTWEKGRLGCRGPHNPDDLGDALYEIGDCEDVLA